MRRSLLRFTGQRTVEIIEEPLAAPGPGQALVTTIISGISAGTELLIYRGQAPRDLPVDETIGALASRFVYPLAYGYAAIGRVTATGADVDTAWLDRVVFAFQPHASHFVAAVDDLLAINADPRDAVFLPNLETAVNLLLDGQPLIGETVVVIGQGVVGLLTVALLARLPLRDLVAVEPLITRQAWARTLGAQACLHPADGEAGLLARLGADRADLTYELSGKPGALDLAISATGYAGRVVVGSWYGEQTVPLTLGGRFHRSKMHVLVSQVSRIAPERSGRWTPRRRLLTAARLLGDVRPARLITHEFALSDAPAAYQLLDERPDQVVQVIFRY